MGTSFLRPLTAAQIVRAALRIYGNNLAAVVMLALVAHLPLIALGTIPAEPTPADALSLALLLVPFLILTGVAVHGILVVLLGAVVDRPVPPARIALLTLRRVVVTVTLTYVLTNLAAHVGLLAFVLPGIILGGWMAPSVPAAVVERRSAFASIGRAFLLARQDVFRAIAVFSFGVLISEFLPLLFLIGMESVAGNGPFSPLLGAVTGAITLPLSLAANVLLYCTSRLGAGATPEALRQEILAALGME